MPNEPLAMRPREIGGAHRNDPAFLERPQKVQEPASFFDGGVIRMYSR